MFFWGEVRVEVGSNGDGNPPGVASSVLCRRQTVLYSMHPYAIHLCIIQVASIAEQVDQQLAWLLDTMHFAKHAPVLKVCWMLSCETFAACTQNPCCL